MNPQTPKSVCLGWARTCERHQAASLDGQSRKYWRETAKYWRRKAKRTKKHTVTRKRR